MSEVSDPACIFFNSSSTEVLMSQVLIGGHIRRPSGMFSCIGIWILQTPISLMIQQQEIGWSQASDLFWDFHHFSFILECDEDRCLFRNIQDSKCNANMKGQKILTSTWLVLSTSISSIIKIPSIFSFSLCWLPSDPHPKPFKFQGFSLH